MKKEIGDLVYTEEKKLIKIREHWLTVIQLLVCVILLAAAFAIKALGGEVYQEVSQWYTYYANASILTEDSMEGIEQNVIDLFFPESLKKYTEESGNLS